MPIYKGANEVASGNLYKGSTEIQDGYKETDPFYVNETTVSFATPTGQGFSYTVPSPQSSTGVPGTTFPTTTFTITGGSQAISGTAVVSGLPSTLAVTGQSYSGSGPGNVLTITIGGTFPTSSSLNTALTISGLSTVTYYTVSLNYSGLTIPTGGTGVSRTGYISGSGAINVTNNGSTWSAQFPAGTSIAVVAAYSASQSGSGSGPTDYRENAFSGGYAGGSFTISSPFTMNNVAPSGTSSSHSVVSSTTTVTGNASYSVSDGYSILSVKTWGYSISPVTSAPILTAVVVGSAGSNNGWDSIARYTTWSGAQLMAMTPPGGGFQYGGVSAVIPAGGYPGNLQMQSTYASTDTITLSWGGGSVYFTCTFS